MRQGQNLGFQSFLLSNIKNCPFLYLVFISLVFEMFFLINEQKDIQVT